MRKMASTEEARSNFEENFEWNVENEIRLFEAMIGHKPVGINKHFHMACISEKFENLMGKPVSSEMIWKHLASMFDLAALDKKELAPFPNDQEEFSLPEAEFSDLINEKLALKTESLADSKESGKESKTPAKVIKDSTPAKDGGAASAAAAAGAKKEKKSDTEETGSSNEGEKKDSTESEGELSKRGKVGKDEKPKRRGNRNAKEKKSEDDTPQTPTSVGKKEEESPFAGSSQKKEKQGVGKRSLRSRADDSLSSKSVTPPPAKRARRI